MVRNGALGIVLALAIDICNNLLTLTTRRSPLLPTPTLLPPIQKQALDLVLGIELALVLELAIELVINIYNKLYYI